MYLQIGDIKDNFKIEKIWGNGTTKWERFSLEPHGGSWEWLSITNENGVENDF